MADPFVAEIRIFPFNFAPKGWAWCDGQLLPLSQNTALFSLLGTTYGGDGKSNFALPDLQGSAPMHPGQGPGLSLHDLGEIGGSETVTLLERDAGAFARRPRSVGSPRESDHAGREQPEPARKRKSLRCHRPHRSSMSPQALQPAGGDQPHNNLQPYLTFSSHRAAGRVPAARDMTDPTLVGRPLTLRPATADDEPFLEKVYAGTRAAELAAVPWTEEEKAAFVQMQFAAQAQSLSGALPRHQLRRHLSTPTGSRRSRGRLYVARWTDEIRIVDIALLPEFCNRGIGTTLLRSSRQKRRPRASRSASTSSASIPR